MIEDFFLLHKVLKQVTKIGETDNDVATPKCVCTCSKRKG